ncbi:MAG: hypothetical protein J4N90_08010 [Chloroflexi bacterium]|nr:hypothetical protein [Chloroflexota bacterium]MCI0824679.1 hypothetical protein [Chloroflexota bacterium]
MDWWILELIKGLGLIILAVVLHRLIRAFGKDYVSDIFRSTPQIGRNFLVLADVAYYLIFAAYTLFWVKLERPHDWAVDVGASQLEQFVFSFAGISLIIGALHGLNVFFLPFIGGVLALRERFGQGAQGD